MFKTFCSHNIEIVKNMVKPLVHVQLRLNHANIIGSFHTHFLYGFTRTTSCNSGRGGTQPPSPIQNKVLLWLWMWLCFAFHDHPCIYITYIKKTKSMDMGEKSQIHSYKICMCILYVQILHLLLCAMLPLKLVGSHGNS
jgi:hypothetical protein